MDVLWFSFLVGLVHLWRMHTCVCIGVAPWRACILAWLLRPEGTKAVVAAVITLGKFGACSVVLR